MDSLVVCERVVGGRKALLAVVCDGVGSMSDGGVASSSAVRLLSGWFNNLGHTERVGLRMRDEVLLINTYIMNLASSQGLNTATTLSALLLIEEQYCIVHSGDSRIYCLSEARGLMQLTADDVSDTGRLTSYIGHKSNPVLHYAEGTAPGKVFLLCSDGLYKRLNTDLLTPHTNFSNRKSMQRTIKVLTNYVIEHGEEDNISVAFVKIES
ncbi:protein phosphatase 2C domain-containing protein [Paenibacillus sp. MMS20-IR301]|uniref:PP2C family protein-serine/threonine phosphatase n=1 Tax=Paenibacillus sp. MMS20-IR301 TaxID=2895946 RepID=UPI0028E364C9|nr:protein phosphatase 2C domain-containing protein [Paenibacillus sp. MMS20-IR301]WNS42896.1 protein phosphatase 2C domain-containing protein [Paenibacillus sp. MMS20-IR301]